MNLKYTHTREIKFDRTQDRDKSSNIICTHNYNRYKCKDSARRINLFILFLQTLISPNPKGIFQKQYLFYMTSLATFHTANHSCLLRTLSPMSV